MIGKDTYSWTGHNPNLDNGDRGAYEFIETYFDQGKIGARNTQALHIDKSLSIDRIPVANSEGEEIEDIEKIIYAHPSRIVYGSGESAPVTYFGGSKGRYNKRKISDSAILVVDEKPPVKNIDELESVGTFLAGDSKDQQLEDESIAIQANPMV